MMSLLLSVAMLTGPNGTDPQVDRVLADARITESSGLVASATHPGVLWTANDSGGDARLYAVGPDGRTRASYLLGGVQARDWEALAPGRDEAGRAVLYVGDIGDNLGVRIQGILVHRVAEPARLADGTLPATSYRLRYPGGPRDAEALLVHPRTGRLFVVTKSLSGGEVYAAPERLDPSGPNLLRRVADAPAAVTDGAFLPDGRLVLRGYGSAYLSAGVGRPAREFALPPAPQGESLAALPGSDAVVVGSEGVASQVWRVPVPALPAPAAAPVSSGADPAGPESGAPGASPVRGDTRSDVGPSRATPSLGLVFWSVNAIAAAGVAIALGIAGRRRIRRGRAAGGRAGPDSTAG